MNGDLKQLIVRPAEIVAIDRVGNREYHTAVTNEATRAEILKEAREFDATGHPRVPQVAVETSARAWPLFPAGFIGLFVAHFFTILLIMGLMPLYIILAIKSDRVDQTMKIIWAVLICMVGMFAMPVYWYLNIWRNAPPGGTSASPS